MQKMILDAFILKGPKKLDESLLSDAIKQFSEKTTSKISAELFVKSFYKLWNEKNLHDIIKKIDPFQQDAQIVIVYKDNQKNRSYKIFQLLFEAELDELFNIH